MSNPFGKSISIALLTMLLANSAMAQQIKVFESWARLQEEIQGHMSEGTFSKLVEAVAPPSRFSGSRVRIVEQALSDDIPKLSQHVRVFSSGAADAVSREVTAWWDGQTYVFLGLMTHSREDGVAVLDFMLTASISKASRWYLTANTQ